MESSSSSLSLEEGLKLNDGSGRMSVFGELYAKKIMITDIDFDIAIFRN